MYWQCFQWKIATIFSQTKVSGIFSTLHKRGHLNWKYVTNSFVMLYWMCFVTYHYLFGTWHICWYYEFPVSMCQCTDPTVVRYWQSGDHNHDNVYLAMSSGTRDIATSQFLAIQLAGHWCFRFLRKIFTMVRCNKTKTCSLSIVWMIVFIQLLCK